MTVKHNDVAALVGIVALLLIAKLAWAQFVFGDLSCAVANCVKVKR